MAAKSKFELVRDALLEEIRKGAYETVQKLPSEYELVERFGVARETARKAVFDLERKGLVRRRKGAGRGAGYRRAAGTGRTLTD